MSWRTWIALCVAGALVAYISYCVFVPWHGAEATSTSPDGRYRCAMFSGEITHPDRFVLYEWTGLRWRRMPGREGQFDGGSNRFVQPRFRWDGNSVTVGDPGGDYHSPTVTGTIKDGQQVWQDGQ